ncbi:MAG: choice-of-anchor Q domain-containing protein, partial [Actinomycetota bacterium]
DCGGLGGAAPVSLGGNLIGNAADCGWVAAGGDLLDVNPLLGPLADNGGPTQTHALLAGSPAIDAAGPGSPSTDQRGAPRGTPDIGAYELVRCQKVVVNHIGTPGDDALIGTAGPDGVLAFEGNDIVNTRGGKDGVCAGPGNDRVKAGGGRDRVSGDSGKDRLSGQGGKDLLRGGGGKDTLIGGGGKDRCSGGGGKDKARGCEKERRIP